MNDNGRRWGLPGRMRRFAHRRGERLLRPVIFLAALAYALGVTLVAVAISGADARPLTGRDRPGVAAAFTTLSP